MKRNPYFDLPGISSSHLSWILPESGGSPELYIYNIANPPEEADSSSINVGIACHAFIEKLDKFNIRIMNIPGPQLKATIDALPLD